MTVKSISPMFAIAFAGLVTMHCAAQVSSSDKVIINNAKGTYRHTTSDGVNNFNLEVRGTIELTDDDKDIKSMSDDGYLEINKTVFGSRRTVVIESQGGGQLKKEYYEDRKRMDWESKGKAWLAEVLPDIIRNTTIGAESRVNRFYQKGGTPAVLAEIEKISSDHAKAHYANLLMKHPVPVSEYANVVNTLARGVNSDHYLSEFLKSNVDKFMESKQAETAFYIATGKLNSDHYKSVVLKEALRNRTVSHDNVKVIMQAARKMSSDHHLTEVLTTLLAQDNLSDAVVSEMVSTTKSINSDHYRAVVLKKALDKPGLSGTSYQNVLESAKEIQSDHYKSEIARHLVKNKLSDEVLSRVLDLSGSINSDHYNSELLRVLINRQDLKESHLNTLVRVCDRIKSDHYKTSVLKEMLRSSNVTENTLQAIINGTKTIGSDHYTTEVLTSIAPKVRGGSKALKDAYLQAAKRIDSETYYGRVVKAIEQ